MLMRTDSRQLLRAHTLFSAFDEHQFERIATAAQIINLGAGEILFQRGAPARAFFIVLHGQIKLSLQSRAGEEKILALEHPGRSFAEAVMFMGAPVYPVDATATEDSALVAIPNRDFLAVLKESPDTCMRLLAGMSQRLHAHVQEIEELTLESASNRLIRHLFRRAQSGPDGRLRVQLEETRQMLASRLAIKPETLSRLLRSLSDAGVIEVDGRDIVIPSLERLHAYDV
jgi:CRP-like cAMP-binding protein